MAYANPPVIIAVAPVAHVEKPVPAGIENPTGPQVVAQQSIECINAGASVVNLHVWDESQPET